MITVWDACGQAEQHLALQHGAGCHGGLAQDLAVESCQVPGFAYHHQQAEGQAQPRNQLHIPASKSITLFTTLLVLDV